MLYSGVAELQAFEGVDKETLIKELEMEPIPEPQPDETNNHVEVNNPGISDNPGKITVDGQTKPVIGGGKKNCKC